MTLREPRHLFQGFDYSLSIKAAIEGKNTEEYWWTVDNFLSEGIGFLVLRGDEVVA